MNQRQLANVLLKVSGIIGVFTALPMLVYGLFSLFSMASVGGSSGHSWTLWMMPVASLTGLIFQLLLVFYSEKIAAKIFPVE